MLTDKPGTASSSAPQAPKTGSASAPTRAQRALVYFMHTPALWTYVVLLVLVIAFTILTGGTFLSIRNVTNVLLDGSLLLIIAVGMTMIIITGGIDLSVGAVTIFASVIASYVMGAIGGDTPATALAGVLAAILIGVVWGAINGAMVGYAKIVALIATLGTLGMAPGLALILTGGVNVSDVPLSVLLGVGNGSLFGVPWLVIIAAIIGILGYLYLGYTRRGLYLYAIGSNEDAASRAGVNVRFNLATVYMISGALAGLAGFLSLARFGTTALAGHTTDNLQAIAAVVLGGTSLFGGRGGIGGTVAGVLIPVVLANGFVILGLQPFWQQFAIGLVLVAAVYADQVRRKRSSQD